MPLSEKWYELDIFDLSNRELASSLRQLLQGFIIPLLKTSSSFYNWKSMLDKQRHWILLHHFYHESKKPVTLSIVVVFPPQTGNKLFPESAVCQLQSRVHVTDTQQLQYTSAAVSAWAVWLFSVFLLGEPHSHTCPQDQRASFMPSHLSQLRGATFTSPPPKNCCAHIKHEGQVNNCAFGFL